MNIVCCQSGVVYHRWQWGFGKMNQNFWKIYFLELQTYQKKSLSKDFNDISKNDSARCYIMTLISKTLNSWFQIKFRNLNYTNLKKKKKKSKFLEFIESTWKFCKLVVYFNIPKFFSKWWKHFVNYNKQKKVCVVLQKQNEWEQWLKATPLTNHSLWKTFSIWLWNCSY